jgi:hypothetical protein
LQRTRLQVNERLGDLDGIAAANWDLAKIDLARQDYQSAYTRLTESFQILHHLQRADGIAVVGSVLGELLLAAGHADNALQVLEKSLAAAIKTDNADLTRRTNELLQQAQALSMASESSVDSNGLSA